MSERRRDAGWQPADELIITFALDGRRHVDLDDVKSRSGKLLVDIEGRFVMAVRGRPVFETEGFLLLEFGLELSRWAEDLEDRRLRHLEYVSMDYDEGPLLTFRCGQDQLWRIESPWIDDPDPVLVSEGPLLAASRGFLESLESALVQKYGIRLRAFLRE